jgi:cysteinyl-tRNA synthetase
MQAWGKPGVIDEDYADRFAAQIDDDLNLPRAIAVMWDLAKSNLPGSTKKATLLRFDRVLGLDLADWQPSESVIPDDILTLVQRRQQARTAKQWQLADQLRGQIAEAGYEIEDTLHGPQVHLAKVEDSA